MMAAQFCVLFVCTGNICRSPMAERMLGQALVEALGARAAAFRIESAGTWGHEGSRMEPYAEAVLRERGARTDAFAARELAPEHLVIADLVLAVTAEHREQVGVLDPFAGGRTFSLGEFARYARMVDPAGLPVGDPVVRARALVERVGRLRHERPATPRPEDDVPDPYGAPLHVFRLCGERIAEGLDGLVRALEATHSRRAG
jgi:protein-tyrosine phosphatase